MGDKLSTLLKEQKPNDFSHLGKLLSAIEERGPRSLQCPELTQCDRFSYRLGITGPPGAGKSTLIGQLITQLRVKNLSVGVIAVDPSSPFSLGAILGDRIRYSEHFNDEQVFIRSLGSRGSLGGLCASAYLMLRAFDYVGFDVVLVETVGVGQSELDVMFVADTVGVVLVPESGDSIQAMKAGILEIADFFIVNKADRPGAEALARELEINYDTDKVLKTKALLGEGIDALLTEVLRHRDQTELAKLRLQPKRLTHEARALLLQEWESQIETQVSQVKSPQDLAALFTKRK